MLNEASVLFSVQQWASLYQPLTFSCEPESSTEVHLNKLDPTKAFRGKAKVPAAKKKQSTQCNVGSAAKGGAGKNTGPKR